MSHLEPWAEEVGRNLQQEYSEEELAAALERSRARQSEAEQRRRAVEERAARALAKGDTPKRKNSTPRGPSTGKPGGGRGLGRGRGRMPLYDRDEMARLFVDEGLKVREIADRLGATDKTVIDGLKARGVYQPRRSAVGRPPKEYCDRGHDMKKWRRANGKQGRGFYCLLCKKERDKEWKKKNRPTKPKSANWTDEDKQTVREWKGSDIELAEELGRTVNAVQQMRFKLKKKEKNGKG